MTGTGDSALGRFDAELAERGEATPELSLFVNGGSALSLRAIADARRLCQTHLPGHTLSVVDVQDDPAAVDRYSVRVVPTLVKHRPLPVRSVVGDLSNAARVLAALGLHVAADHPDAVVESGPAPLPSAS